ncbi:MAG: TIGR02466 family protein [Pseudomonadota bacterium]
MSGYGDIKVQAQRIALFETPIVTAHFAGGDDLIADLETVIRRNMAEDPNGVKRSNIGGWHSDTHMLDWGGAPARLLADRAVAMAKRLSNFGHNSHDDYHWLVQMWANVSPPGASNHMHIHPGNLWSAVLYIDMGGAGETGNDTSDAGGEFYFEDPRFPLAAMHNTAFRFIGADGQPQLWQPEFRPKRGDFLMFPAWLRHGVRPYTGDRQRISIALNVDAVLR